MNTPTQATPEIRPDSTQTVGEAANQDITPTTGLECIRFDATPTGYLSLTSPTSWGDLLALGALSKAGTETFVTPTDLAGLELLAGQLSNALETVLDGLELVGRLAALAGRGLDVDDVTRLGWLISGLSELGNELRHEAENANHELQRRREAGRDNGAAIRAPGADGRGG